MPFADEFDELDREEAIYWFAYSWHGGQGSNLYSALSTSPYSPGLLCDSAQMLVDVLEDEYCDAGVER